MRQLLWSLVYQGWPSTNTGLDMGNNSIPATDTRMGSSSLPQKMVGLSSAHFLLRPTQRPRRLKRGCSCCENIPISAILKSSCVFRYRQDSVHRVSGCDQDNPVVNTRTRLEDISLARRHTGLISRWRKPTEWMASMDSRICFPSLRVVLMVNVPLG